MRKSANQTDVEAGNARCGVSSPLNLMISNTLTMQHRASVSNQRKHCKCRICNHASWVESSQSICDGKAWQVLSNPKQRDSATNKIGVWAISKTDTADYAGQGIRTNCVSPGWIKTAMTQNIPSEAVGDIPLSRAAETDPRRLMY